MTTPRIVLASTIVLPLGGQTIRSRVVMAVAEPHGFVRVNVVALSTRTAVDPSKTTTDALTSFRARRLAHRHGGLGHGWPLSLPLHVLMVSLAGRAGRSLRELS